jgi:solute carrier family 20 (sodium-dependent phosphate transporter)
VGGCGGAWDAKILKLPDSVGPYSASESSIPHPFSMIPILITPIFLPVYSAWSTGLASTSNTATPVWIYVFGGGCLVVGLATYGYNIMRVMGNKLTLMSPSRGFSMELGSAVTILLASICECHHWTTLCYFQARLMTDVVDGIPVSTTMCITGATLGVGLCNGDREYFGVSDAHSL